MLELKNGNLLTEDAEALVNTVNCVGVMGRGIALQFKNAFPENYKAYVKACNSGELNPGKVFVYKTGQIINPRYIINFPTKRHWRGKSRIEDITTGLVDLVRVVKKNGITSIAVPPLGCGLGGLDWEEVKSQIETAFSDIDGVKVALFEPSGAPAAESMKHAAKAPTMTAGRAALVALMDKYIEALLDPFVTLLEVHKLMYFLQEAGEPLKLKYQAAQHGPYADNLRHVLTAVEGYYISGFADGGDSPGKRLELVPGAVGDACKELASSPETNERTNRVIELVDGFESSFGLELLATVHWVYRNKNVTDINDIIQKTYAWNESKRKFSERQIAIAYNALEDKDWFV